MLLSGLLLLFEILDQAGLSFDVAIDGIALARVTGAGASVADLATAASALMVIGLVNVAFARFHGRIRSAAPPRGAAE